MLGQGGQAQSPLLRMALQVLQQNGGVEGILDKFRQGGYADQAASWQSTGQNIPLPGSALQEVLGTGAIGQIAQQLGMERIIPEDNTRTFRISTSTLGAGYVEAIANATLLAIRDAQPAELRGTAIMTGSKLHAPYSRTPEFRKRKLLQGALASAFAASALVAGSAADARIVSVQMNAPTVAFGGFSFPGVGRYVKIVGVAYAEVDPADARNAVIVDLSMAQQIGRASCRERG